MDVMRNEDSRGNGQTGKEESMEVFNKKKSNINDT